MFAMFACIPGIEGYPGMKTAGLGLTEQVHPGIGIESKFPGLGYPRIATLPERRRKYV